MKKSLLIIALLATALAACSRREATVGITLPTYACTTTPTGVSGVKQEEESCGRHCSRNVDYAVHEVHITCDYKEWRRQ